MDKPQYELAEVDYINGMKYKEIAHKYNVSINTVKSWKTRYKWNKDKKGMHTKEKVCTQKTHNKKKVKEPIAEEVKDVLENTELTDKQRLFCIYYIKYFNATKAYKKAYGCSYEVALVNGPRLLGNARVKNEIQALKESKLNRAMLTEEDIFQRYMDIAFSDIGDYLRFGKKKVKHWTKDEEGNDIPVIDPETGKQKYSEYNIVELNESEEVDTTLLSEISEGKDGVKLKLYDKMKAMQWLSDRMDLLPKATVEKLELEKSKLELARIKAGENDSDNEEFEDDGFMDAIKSSVKEVVWTDEEIN